MGNYSLVSYEIEPESGLGFIPDEPGEAKPSAGTDCQGGCRRETEPEADPGVFGVKRRSWVGWPEPAEVYGPVNQALCQQRYEE